MTLSPAVNVTVFAIRFHKVGKLYHFAAQHHPDLKTGDHVIVETKRGVQMGEVVKRVQDGYNPNEELKPVIRPANARDLVLRQAWQLRELPALITCREQAASLRLQQVKWIKAEYSYDGGFLTFFYAMEEEDQQADQQQLNLLKQKLQQGFGDSHIYFQHIGPRDVAKLLGGYGACGSPRCCSTFLTDFSPVSIKMAKDQGLSLDPAEITGMCGRLRCCLVYEYEQYVEARKTLPKLKKIVGTPAGEGKVIDIYPLREVVRVLLADGQQREFHRSELEPLEEFRALQAKAQAGCSKHAEGGCDCGAKEKSAPIEPSVNPTPPAANPKPTKKRNDKAGNA